MISRSLIADSNMTLWNVAFDKPPGEMGFDAKTEQTSRELLIIKARPDVSRVIYSSASHRGSKMATGFLGRLGAKVIGSSVAENMISDEAIAASQAGSKLGRMPSSVDAVDPGSPFLLAVDTLPPNAGVRPGNSKAPFRKGTAKSCQFMMPLIL